MVVVDMSLQKCHRFAVTKALYSFIVTKMSPLRGYKSFV